MPRNPRDGNSGVQPALVPLLKCKEKKKGRGSKVRGINGAFFSFAVFQTFTVSLFIFLENPQTS